MTERRERTMSPDEVVDVVTPDEVKEAIQAHLDRLGLTYDKLREQAEREAFTSREARLLWLAIDHFAEKA